MRYLRGVDFGAYERDRYGAQFLYSGGSALAGPPIATTGRSPNATSR